MKVWDAPHLAQVSSDEASALKEAGARYWIREVPGEFEREAYLPLPDLLEHFDIRRSLGAAQLDHQLGRVTIVLPATGLIRIGDQAPGYGIGIEGSEVRIGTTTCIVPLEGPTGPVYYRISINPAMVGKGKAFHQQIVIPYDPGSTKYAILTGVGEALVRKELLLCWYRLLDNLPRLP